MDDGSDTCRRQDAYMYAQLAEGAYRGASDMPRGQAPSVSRFMVAGLLHNALKQRPRVAVLHTACSGEDSLFQRTCS